MQNEQDYFRGVYEETYPDLLRYVVIQTRRAGDVEDILQNAYAKFYRRITLRGYADIENARAFLMTVVQKELKGYYRFRLTRAANEEALPEDGPAGSFTPEDAAVGRDTLRRVWRIIETAPVLSYKAFVLHYRFEASVPEIARALGLTEANVTSRLYRLRQRIRARMEQEELQ